MRIKRSETTTLCNVCRKEMFSWDDNMRYLLLYNDDDFDICSDCYNVVEVLEKRGLIRIVKKGQRCNGE